MPWTTLPTARQFVTQLLDSLPSTRPAADAAPTTNPLHNVPDEVKKQLLTLQVLFPNEFVPALDLLDRRLVTRFHIRDHDQEDGTPHQPQPPPPDDPTMPDPNTQHKETNPRPLAHSTPYPPRTIYYVRSAQPRPSRFSTSIDSTSSYQVRLPAWHCTCPAFTFAAFPAPSQPEPPCPSPPPHHHLPPTPTHRTSVHTAEKHAWVFGGAALASPLPPLCKHLLACVLVERCTTVFAGCDEETVSVSVEEAAGWAAGWGD